MPMTHPFLFFSEADLPALRRKAEGPVCKAILKNMERVADARLSWEVYIPALVPPFSGYRLKAGQSMNYDEDYAARYVQQYRASMLIRNLSEFYAFCYLMLGKEKYREAARRWTLTPCRWDKRTWAAYEESRLPIEDYTAAELRSVEKSGGACVGVVVDPEKDYKKPIFEDTGIFTTFKLRGLAVAYDWMCPHLTDEERETVRGMLAYQGDRLYHHALNRNALLMNSILNHTWLDTAGFGLAGVALYFEHPPAREWVKLCRDRFVDLLLPRTVGADGEFPEPGPYVWEYSYTAAALFFEGLRRVTGEDLFASPAFRRVSHLLTHVLSPAGGLAFDDDMTGFDRADGMACAFRPLMFRFASRFRDPQAQRYALYEGFDPPGAEKGKLYPGGKWYPEAREYNGHWEYIWCDESIPPQDPSGPVPSTLLRDAGWAILRTGWRPHDTYLALRGGTYLGPHDRMDQNKVVLQSGGEKLLEHLYGANYMHFEYFKYTPGSNTILVDGEGQTEVPKEAQHATFMSQYKTENTNGRILLFEPSPDFDAVIGDASGAYGDRLTRFWRCIAFLKPDCFLILDDLVAPRPSAFDWLAHSYGDISIQGSDILIRKPKASLLIRAVLPEGASWHLEHTPPDTKDERLLKHLALRPSRKTPSVRFLTGLFVSPADREPLSLHAEEHNDSIIARLTLRGRSLSVEFDLAAKKIQLLQN